MDRKRQAAACVCLAALALFGCKKEGPRDYVNRGIARLALEDLRAGRPIGGTQALSVRDACKETPSPPCAELLAKIPTDGN